MKYEKIKLNNGSEYEIVPVGFGRVQTRHL